ncbi:MAG: PaaI family thioesterase [Candidatus Binatia bacterium]
MTDDARQRCEQVAYHASLGVQVEELERDRVRLRVPYKDENSNPGRALHGGVAASTIGIAGALAAWSGVEARPDLEHGTLDLSVNYLAAALGEDIVATAEVLRRGKELSYSEVDVRTEAGKRIAIGLVTSRIFDRAANPAAAHRQRTTPVERAAGSEVIKGAKVFTVAPFMARLGVVVEHAADGRSSLRMAHQAVLADAAGGLHEGALAALIDTSGALASWSITGLDLSYKASTVGIHVNYHAGTAGEDVVAQARTLRRNNEIFLNQVTVSGASSGRLVASASVTYRIVVG